MLEGTAQPLVHFSTSTLATLESLVLELRSTMRTTSSLLGSLSEWSLSMLIVVTPTSVSVLLTAVLRDERESTDVLVLAISF